MKAVIYARYSSDNQREESIEGQLRECKEFAEKNDITIIGEYIDRALSAKTDNRPNFQKMIKDSYRKIFDTVIVWKVDRFARNRYDSAHYKNILKKNGVKVISAKEHISEGAEGIILEAMLEGFEHTNGHNKLKSRIKAVKSMQKQREPNTRLSFFFISDDFFSCVSIFHNNVSNSSEANVISDFLSVSIAKYLQTVLSCKFWTFPPIFSLTTGSKSTGCISSKASY